MVHPGYGVTIFIIGGNLLANFLDENLQNPRCHFASLRLFVSPSKTTSGDKHKKQRKSKPCGIQIKQCVKILQYLSLTRLTNLGVILFYRLQMILFVFYVYRHLTSKNAKGITGGLADFRKRTCSRKEIRQYTGKPEERGLYLSDGVLLVFV